MIEVILGPHKRLQNLHRDPESVNFGIQTIGARLEFNASDIAKPRANISGYSYRFFNIQALYQQHRSSDITHLDIVNAIFIFNQYLVERVKIHPLT